jgi:SPOR domain
MMDDFMYYLKRYLLAIFIIILLLFFPARRFLRKNGFFVFGNKALKEALLWAHQDSIRVADSLKRIKIESVTPVKKQQDSRVKPIKKEIPLKATETESTYFIIAGSFTNSENARLASEKYLKGGYKTSIISLTGKNGVKTELVSVKTFNSPGEAARFLKEFKSKYDHEAWIYSHK